jgi:hypothetical protein
MPPRRSCDHSIPLVPGAIPVHARHYIYALALKTEIEKQVSDMLAAGIIQPSTNAFSSLVLLVKKKYVTWRFCIDYKGLNALTVKGKFPLPVIDEFMDETVICLVRHEDSNSFICASLFDLSISQAQ